MCETSECICVGAGTHTIGIHISLCTYPGKDPSSHPSLLAASALLQALPWPWTALPEAKSALGGGLPTACPHLGVIPKSRFKPHPGPQSPEHSSGTEMRPVPEARSNKVRGQIHCLCPWHSCLQPNFPLAQDCDRASITCPPWETDLSPETLETELGSGENVLTMPIPGD